MTGVSRGVREAWRGEPAPEVVVTPTRLTQRDALHPCPHPECSRTVPALMWACLEHWQGLPPPIRQGIWAATRTSGPGSLQLQNAEERAFAFWGSIERELREIAAGESAEPPRTIA
jgi:hypothetical protein